MRAPPRGVEGRERPGSAHSPTRELPTHPADPQAGVTLSEARCGGVPSIDDQRDRAWPAVGVALTRVRRIGAADGELLRELRLRSLLDAPRAFGQSHDDAAAREAAEWRAQARAASDGDHRAWFIAAEREANVGLIMSRRRSPGDALIFSMWVDPRHRRTGAGRALVDAVDAWARRWGAERLVLWVIADNDSALRFYDRLGFMVLKEGPDAESGAQYGALAMVRPISRADLQAAGAGEAS